MIGDAVASGASSRLNLDPATLASHAQIARDAAIMAGAGVDAQVHASWRQDGHLRIVVLVPAVIVGTKRRQHIAEVVVLAVKYKSHVTSTIGVQVRERWRGWPAD